MKKIVSMLLIAMLSLSIVVTASFADDEIETLDTLPVTVEDPYGDFIGAMSYSEYMQFLYGENLMMPYSTTGIVEKKSLSFTKYLQMDSRWSSYQLLNGSSTIGLKGCALTSTAMLLDYFGYNDNPKEVNDNLLPYQPANNGSMHWYHVESAYSVSVKKADLLDNEKDQYASIDEVYPIVRGQIRLNRPVILGLTKPGKTHFVVVRGILETEYNAEAGTIDKKYIYIHDPGSLKATQLEDYFDAGYKVYRVISYDD